MGESEGAAGLVEVGLESGEDVGGGHWVGVVEVEVCQCQGAWWCCAAVAGCVAVSEPGEVLVAWAGVDERSKL